VTALRQLRGFEVRPKDGYTSNLLRGDSLGAADGQLLGSVPGDVAKNAACDVLIVQTSDVDGDPVTVQTGGSNGDPVT
jgi:hypothetical protein